METTKAGGWGRERITIATKNGATKGRRRDYTKAIEARLLQYVCIWVSNSYGWCSVEHAQPPKETRTSTRKYDQGTSVERHTGPEAETLTFAPHNYSCSCFGQRLCSALSTSSDACDPLEEKMHCWQGPHPITQVLQGAWPSFSRTQHAMNKGFRESRPTATLQQLQPTSCHKVSI